ncbi:plasmid replication initiator RepA [Methylococcaceae bacterium HT2]|nr:plasmid replication initiator RepA [Methylococcaceae bacterium HT2]
MANPLLPVRHPEKDLFICDFGEVIPKSDIASMEHPLFTLSTKPDTAIRNYEHNGNTVRIAPSAYGLATIHDKDILIYCISQLMAGLNQGETPSRKIRFKAHDLLVTTNRQTSGQGYKLLRQAFDRLHGTSITTNIKTNGQEVIEGFHIIDAYKIVIDDPKTKRMIELEVTLSEWLYNSVIGEEILSIDHDYFRLRKPIERRIYEIARKHCGKQKKWYIGLKNLHKKVGSSGNIRLFKQSVNHITKHNHLPEYNLRIEGENVIFNYKDYQEKKAITTKQESRPFIKPDTIEKAKRILGRHFDVYALESDWLQWWEQSGKPELQSPDGAFFNFCKARMEKIQGS